MNLDQTHDWHQIVYRNPSSTARLAAWFPSPPLGSSRFKNLGCQKRSKAAPARKYDTWPSLRLRYNSNIWYLTLSYRRFRCCMCAGAECLGLLHASHEQSFQPDHRPFTGKVQIHTNVGRTLNTARCACFRTKEATASVAIKTFLNGAVEEHSWTSYRKTPVLWAPHEHATFILHHIYLSVTYFAYAIFSKLRPSIGRSVVETDAFIAWAACYSWLLGHFSLWRPMQAIRHRQQHKQHEANEIIWAANQHHLQKGSKMFQVSRELDALLMEHKNL